MARERPLSSDGLAALYLFGPLGTKGGGLSLALDASGTGNHLDLRGSGPSFVYSTAPLTMPDGKLMRPAMPGAGGYALALSDQQVGAQYTILL